MTNFHRSFNEVHTGHIPYATTATSESQNCRLNRETSDLGGLDVTVIYCEIIHHCSHDIDNDITFHIKTMQHIISVNLRLSAIPWKV